MVADFADFMRLRSVRGRAKRSVQPRPPRLPQSHDRSRRGLSPVSLRDDPVPHPSTIDFSWIFLSLARRAGALRNITPKVPFGDHKENGLWPKPWLPLHLAATNFALSMPLGQTASQKSFHQPLDHDDFGSIRSKIIVIDSRNLVRECKTGSHFCASRSCHARTHWPACFNGVRIGTHSHPATKAGERTAPAMPLNQNNGSTCVYFFSFLIVSSPSNGTRRAGGTTLGPPVRTRLPSILRLPSANRAKASG